MKIICLIFFLNLSFAQSQDVQVKPLNKIPKSLFLLKKSRVDNEIGEPIVYPSEKQSELLNREKVFNKYRLEVIESDN